MDAHIRCWWCYYFMDGKNIINLLYIIIIEIIIRESFDMEKKDKLYYITYRNIIQNKMDL